MLAARGLFWGVPAIFTVILLAAPRPWMALFGALLGLACLLLARLTLPSRRELWLYSAAWLCVFLVAGLQSGLLGK